MASKSIDSLVDQHLRRAASIDTISRPPLSCCCGEEDCEFLRRGSQTVEQLEGDVKAAATVGQALLSRHEQYIADTQKEKARSNGRISELEDVNRTLENENARIISDNRRLFNRVDELEKSIQESETHVKALTATLESTQSQANKVNSLATRAHYLEVQLREYEEDHERLMRQLHASNASEKEANALRREHEKQLEVLSEQLERIEKEAEEDRRTHAEVVQRLERKQAMRDELDQDRKAKAESKQGHRNEAITNLVKEILEDNANLNISILELQQTLTNSEQEAEELREQLFEARYAEHSGRSRDHEERHVSLQSELTAMSETTPSAAPPSSPSPASATPAASVHVHHHYHAPPVSSLNNSRRAIQMRKKPRPSQGSIGSNGSGSEMCNPFSSSASLHSRHHSKRSSMASSVFTGPSSPQSTIFDRPFTDDNASSRPASPISDWVGSPSLRAMSDEMQFSKSLPFDGHYAQGSTTPTLTTLRPLSAQHQHQQSQSPIPIIIPSDSLLPTSAIPTTPLSQIAEEIPAPSTTNTVTTITRSPAKPIPGAHVQPPITPLSRRHRPRSGSISSISGMDLHTSLPSSMPSPTKTPLNTRTMRAARPPAFPRLSGAGRATASVSSTSTFAPLLDGKSRPGVSSAALSGAAQNALGRALDAQAMGKDGKVGGYDPLTDTFGRKLGGWLAQGWGGRGWKLGGGGSGAAAVSEDEAAGGAVESESGGGGGDPPAAVVVTDETKPDVVEDVKVENDAVDIQVDEDALRECLEG